MVSIEKQKIKLAKGEVFMKKETSVFIAICLVVNSLQPSGGESVRA